VNFGTADYTASGKSLIFNQNGLEITASAYESTVIDPLDFFFTDVRQVTVSTHGLGVDGTGGLFVSEPSYEIDGVGTNEFLTLSSNQEVGLQNFTLGKIDSWGSDGVKVFSVNASGMLQPVWWETSISGSGVVTIDLDTPFLGNEFVFTVVGAHGFL